MYVLIEMVDLDVIGVRLMLTKEKADEVFDSMMEQNGVTEYDADELLKEAQGTVRMAGDDSYSVQMLEINPEH